jgi:hypothetical protein
MKAYSAYSTNLDAYAAGCEAAKELNCKGAKLAFVYASCDYDLKKVLKGVSETLKCPIIGNTSFTGVIMQGGYVGGDKPFVGIMALTGKDIEVGVAMAKRSAFETAREAGVAVAKKAMLNKAVPSQVYMVASPTEEEQFLKGISEVIGRVPTFGGSCADNEIAGKWSLYTDKGITNEGVAVAFIYTKANFANEFTGAYHETKDKYLDMLRETLDNTTEILNVKITEVLTNADVVLDGINTTAGSYGVTLNTLLTSPWGAASEKSLAFKTDVEDYLTPLTNEDGVVTVFGRNANGSLTSPFMNGSTAAQGFATSVNTNVGNSGASGSISSFSNENYGKLDTPFISGSGAAQSFATHIGINLGALGAGGSIVDFGTENYGKLDTPFDSGDTASGDFKTNVDTNLGASGASGSIDSFITNTNGELDTPFNSGSTAAGAFTTTVNTEIGNVKDTVYDSTSFLTDGLGNPWESATEDNGPISTFDSEVEGAINDAIDQVEGENGRGYLDNELDEPWETDAPDTFSDNVETQLDEVEDEVTGENNEGYLGDELDKPWETDAPYTFADTVEAALNEAIRITKEKIKELNNETSKYNPPSYSGNGSKDTGNKDTGNKDTGGNNPGGGTKYKTGPAVSALQKFLNQNWNNAILAVTGSSQLEVDGSYGPLTKKVVKEVQKRINMNPSAQKGEWNADTIAAMESYYTGKMRASTYQSSVEDYKKRRDAIPSRVYAKGTLGTQKDGWAYTDEPWLGDEIVLVPGKNGNLQYMRKGTAVMPADISENLMEWGKINPDMSNISNGVHGVNLMSNYVSKPEINLTFDALVKADNITEDTLPEVKKFVQQEINNLVKQMNYALKGYSR